MQLSGEENEQFGCNATFCQAGISLGAFMRAVGYLEIRRRSRFTLAPHHR